MASLIKEEMYMVQPRFAVKGKEKLRSLQIAQISVWLLEQGIPGVWVFLRVATADPCVFSLKSQACVWQLNCRSLCT